MMRENFLKKLEELNEELIAMGNLVESAIANAVMTITSDNAEYAENAISIEVQIDEKEKEIENLCLKLLLKQQPVAKDLRIVSAALKMITDMERIGDQAQDIAEISKYDLKSRNLFSIEHIKKMAKCTIDMVNKSIEAFIKKDVELALAVVKQDDEVDDLFEKIKTDLIDLIKSDQTDNEDVLNILLICKYFERIGDHATNIAEWVEFAE